MEELREVTIQYTTCADPTENAARKRRVLQGETRGLMAETAAQIIEAVTFSNQNYMGTAEEHQSSQDPPQLK